MADTDQRCLAPSDPVHVLILSVFEPFMLKDVDTHQLLILVSS